MFNNDLTNLLPGKIDAYDAIFLNASSARLFADPAVRDSAGRVRQEGRRTGRHPRHAVGVAQLDRVHRDDRLEGRAASDRAGHHARLRSRRARSPSRSTGRPLPFKEEYYRFHIEGARRLRWNDVRVLLTVDLDDPAIEPRPWTGYTRADKIYPVSWIRTYGKGRVFYTSIGHMPETFMTPALVGHMLAGVQYALGDLEADATPNPPGAGSVSSR